MTIWFTGNGEFPSLMALCKERAAIQETSRASEKGGGRMQEMEQREMQLVHMVHHEWNTDCRRLVKDS